MESKPPVDAENAGSVTNATDVAMLAAHAALPLDPRRIAAVAAILSAWLPDANALSRKMSAPEYRALMPATIFAHAPDASDPAGERA
jgi:hypothetical protein